MKGRAGRDEPFFLYFAMPSPHTPIAPHADYRGRKTVVIHFASW